MQYIIDIEKAATIASWTRGLTDTRSPKGDKIAKYHNKLNQFQKLDFSQIFPKKHDSRHENGIVLLFAATMNTSLSSASRPTLRCYSALLTT
jgi:hypothetical protein